MKIKDIVNRDLVNLENCESEPIHIPGSIQPHGFLIAVGSTDLKINFCSGNSIDFIGIEHTALLGKTFETAFGGGQAEKLRAYITNTTLDASKPYVFTWNETDYNTLIHKSGHDLILDLEPYPDGSLTLPDLYSQTKRFVSYLERSVTLQDLCKIIAEETRNITGYDRVMIYRFDKEYNGEVFAESKREDLESFFGLHYPHTDIPVQARELYMRNLLRIIVDVNYKPVPLYTIDEGKPKNLDLSDSVLRSVSPIHIEYLHNIGVGATLTISLIHNKKLWGLIACHHYSHKNLPHFTRLAAQLQGHFLTSQINVREVAEEYDATQIINNSLEKLMQNSAEVSGGNFKLMLNDDLLKITNSNGVTFISDGIMHCFGSVPADKELTSLLKWLASRHEKGFFATSHLSKDYSEGTKISDVAAGILFHSLGNPLNDSIIWFRPEVEKTVNWAGDPSKAIIKNEKGLSPRKSFELWKENTRNQSEDWEEIELNTASKFAYALQKQTYLLYLTREETKYRRLSEKLQKANAELENINWISNHDLKEPLRKIQVFTSKIMVDESVNLSEFATESLRRMNDSANRMQTLLNDLMAYSHMKDLSEAFKPLSLTKTIEDIRAELKEELEDAKATIKTEDLPEINAISFQIHQLFLNLIRNSLKFSKPSEAPSIVISSKKIEGPYNQADLDDEKEYYLVSFQDNGIGFNNDYSVAIFNVFKRLHSAKKYTGTGIGLAICKKIMENHEGTITAQGEVNKGSTFSLYFPVFKTQEQI